MRVAIVAFPSFGSACFLFTFCFSTLSVHINMEAGIEDAPLLPSGGLRQRKWRSVVFVMKELKKVSLVAAPTVAVMAMLYLLQVVSMTMVGHLDDDDHQLLFSGVSIATSFTSVTGFSLIVKSLSAFPVYSLVYIHTLISCFALASLIQRV